MTLREIRKRLTTGDTLVNVIRENPHLDRSRVLKATQPLGYTRQGVDHAYRVNGIRRRAVRSDKGKPRKTTVTGEGIES